MNYNNKEHSVHIVWTKWQKVKYTGIQIVEKLVHINSLVFFGTSAHKTWAQEKQIIHGN